MRSLQRRVTHALVASATFCAVLVWASTTASAAPQVRDVPGDYPSVQAAIDAAVNGDTVLVAPGTYKERLDFGGKAIKVKSTAGPATTVIDADAVIGGVAVGPAVTFKSGEPRGAVLNGFTVRHGVGIGRTGLLPGAGINITKSSPTIKHNVIELSNGGQFGAGVGINGGAALVEGNTIQHNIGHIGAGVGVWGAATAPVIVGNTIQDNVNDDGVFGGGLSWYAAGPGVVRNNIIRRNTAVGDGGGACLNPSAPGFVFAQNLITDNVVKPVGGGFVHQFGGGVEWRGVAGTMVNNTIADNHAVDGVGVYFADTTPFTQVFNNIVTANEGVSVLHCEVFRPGYVPYLAANNVHSAMAVTYAGACAAGPIGPHNISADPLFVDAAGGDNHLGPTSPSINAGDDTAPGLTLTDLDGNPRIVGSAIDQGAYEAQPGADLALGLTAAPNPVTTDEQLTWTLTATNHGPHTATGVHVNDAWPNALHGGVRFRRVTTSAGSCAWDGGTGLTCSLGSLASGASATITIVVKPRGRGVLTNTATLTANELDPSPADSTASVRVTVRPDEATAA